MRWPGHLFRMPPGPLPGEGFWAHPSGRGPPGKTQDKLKRLFVLAGLGMPGDPPEGLEEVAREMEVRVSLLRLLLI